MEIEKCYLVDSKNDILKCSYTFKMYKEFFNAFMTLLRITTDRHTVI